MVRDLRLLHVSAATQTSPYDWVDTPVRKLSKNLTGDDIELQRLEFYNSGVIDTLGGYHPPIRWEGLANYPEVYEVPFVDPDSGESTGPREEEEQDNNKEKEYCPAVTTTPIRRKTPDRTPEKTPVVKVPDKNPPCPCCKDRIDGVQGLADHLKRVHGKRKIKFQCAKCGRENKKYHSIACHFPYCKGPVGTAPAGEWTCEVCGRSFQSKIGLGQHKRLSHPSERNLERIAASRPKEKSNQGAHRKCWSAEEEELLIKLMEQFKGSWNINKLIAEHIPSKTTKQISDKRRLLEPG